MPRYFTPTRSSLNSTSSSPALLTRNTRMESKIDNISPDKQSRNYDTNIDSAENDNNNNNNNGNSSIHLYDSMNVNVNVNQKSHSKSYHHIERSKLYSNRSHIPFGGRSVSPAHLPKATSTSTSTLISVMTPVSLPTSPYDTQFERMRITNTDVPPNAGLALWGNPTVTGNGNDSIVSVKDINDPHSKEKESLKPFFS